MKFHNRAFPYPILDTTDEVRQDFVDGDFQVVFEEEEGDDEITINVTYMCSVVEITDLVESGKASFSLLVVCPATLVRHAFLSNSVQQSITLKLEEFYGEVELSPQIVVRESVQGFCSEDLNEEFRDTAFDLYPGDVIAVADSEVKTFIPDGMRLENLIKARLNEALDPHQYQIELGDSKIYIDMGAKLHRIWGEVRREQAARPFIFMSIYKDMFLMALEELATDSSAMEKRWGSEIKGLADNTGLPFNETCNLNEINLVAQRILQADTIDRLSKKYLGGN